MGREEVKEEPEWYRRVLIKGILESEYGIDLDEAKAPDDLPEDMPPQVRDMF